MHQHIDITLIACSVYFLRLYPSIAYCRSIVKIRALNGAIDIIQGNLHSYITWNRKYRDQNQNKTRCQNIIYSCIYIYIYNQENINFNLHLNLWLMLIICYTIDKTVGNMCTTLGRVGRYSAFYRMLATLDLNQL